MVKHLLLKIAILWALATPVYADKEADVTYIVEQTITIAHVEQVLSDQKRAVMFEAVRRLGRIGIDISEPEPFFDLLFSEFSEELVIAMRTQKAAFYRSHFSASELRDIARFYASPTGQKLAAESAFLLKQAVVHARLATQEAANHAPHRLAIKLRDENILLENNPGLTQAFIEAFE
ncbi:DUF2059 domain-containing protein [Shimia litoralis]|mgnify:FL=1|uniref:DUF2059 domain-containing protein n=1 Tax=Shimia litoralis TaxID=420403 RepID=A0A4V6F290_9RHOB|nr:DUF2059 domain-containing protein [Shimia litoralis]TKZ22401.1 DUF2059 domain-containing protein [Shimia litoralis]